MNDFFNPKSMTTPGMAGGLVMMLANALCYQFPELTPRWVGLALSFVIGGYVVAKANPWLSRAGFWFVNSLIIFTVAMGSARVAEQATSRPPVDQRTLLDVLVPSAHAQTAAPTEAELRQRIEAMEKELEQQRKKLEAANQKNPTQAARVSQPADQKFFKKW